MITTRPLTPEDYPLYLAMIQRNVDNLPFDWPQHATLESLAETMPGRDTHLIFIKGEMAGVIEFRDFGDHVELGYWMDWQFRGRRIMTTLVRNIMRDGRKYTAKVLRTNEAGIALCRSVGMINTRIEGEYFVYMKGY